MKQVLITGGATGIGAATAQVFLERGYRVFVTVHQTAAELPGVTAIPCDITDPAAVERLFAAVGTVDVLVNNAGISLIRQIQDTTPEDYDALMGVNCKGVFLCSRAAAVDMLRRHSGAIVNVSSMGAGGRLLRNGVFHEQGRGDRLHPGTGPGAGAGGHCRQLCGAGNH